MAISVLSWVIHSAIKEIVRLAWLFCQESRKRFGKLFLYAFVFWIIWNERNKRSFENVELFDHRLKFFFV